jgi:hypothetical protein
MWDLWGFRHSTLKMNQLGLMQEAILAEVQQIVRSSIERDMLGTGNIADWMSSASLYRNIPRECHPQHYLNRGVTATVIMTTRQ